MESKTAKLARAVIDIESSLRAQRSAEEALWQEIYEFAMPDRAYFTSEVSEGVSRRRDLLDSTAERSLELFASFVYTTLNNPSTQWIEVAAINPDRALQNSAVYLKAVEDLQKSIQEWIVSGQSGIYDALHECYLDLGAIGNACMSLDLAGGTSLRAINKHMSDVIFDEDANNRPNATFVQYHWTNEQIAQKFGESALLKEGEARPDAEQMYKRRTEPGRHKMLHAEFPRLPAQYALATHLPPMTGDGPYANLWVHCEHKTVMPNSIKSSRTKQYAVGRWMRTRNRREGRGPGASALPEIRMVNRISASIIKASEKLNDPPMAVRDGSLLSPLRLFSGGISYYDGDQPPTPLLPPGASRVDVGDALLQSRQGAIREAFFTPLFLNPDNPVRTATEVLQIADERNRAVGPMLTRVQHELFIPLVERALDLGEIAGTTPELPQILEDKKLRIQYRSPLTASQLQVEALGVARAFEGIAPWAQIDPSVLDGYDMDVIRATVNAGSGAPAGITVTDDVLKKRRKAREEAQKAAQAQEMAAEVGIPAAKVAVEQQKAKK